MRFRVPPSAFLLTLVLLAAIPASAQQSAEELIQRGRDQLEKKQYVDAHASFDAAIKLDPNLPAAYFYRGKIQTDNKLGVADLTKAIELKPDYAEAYFERGLINDLDSHPALAMADYNKAIELNPRYTAAYRGRAVLYLLDNQGAKAIADYTKIIELKPDGDSYYMRGNSYLEIGQAANAVVDLTRAIQLDPTYYWSYKQRAKAYRQLRKYGLAEADERKASAIGAPK